MAMIDPSTEPMHIYWIRDQVSGKTFLWVGLKHVDNGRMNKAERVISCDPDGRVVVLKDKYDVLDGDDLLPELHRIQPKDVL